MANPTGIFTQQELHTNKTNTHSIEEEAMDDHEDAFPFNKNAAKS